MPIVAKWTLPILHNTIEFVSRTSDFHDWLMSMCQQYQGKSFVLRVLGQPDIVVLCTPESVEDVMKTHFESFPKGDTVYEAMGDMFGGGLFASDGDQWAHQRKVASNLFTARKLRETMTESIRKHTIVLRRMLEEAAGQDKTVDLFKLFNRFTIEAFAEIGFGIRMNSMESADEHPFQTAFDRVQRATVLRFVRPSWFWKLQRLVQVGVERQLRQDINTIDGTVLDIISQSIQRRQLGENQRDGADLVSLVLDYNEKTPEAKSGEFDPHYLRDIVVNFLIAGRDTTAQALSWFFKNVGTHPEVVTKIRAEIKHVLPGLMDGSIETPTMEQVQQLTFLEAAIKESLRLYPAVPVSFRVAANDVVLSDGTFIRKGQSVAVPVYGCSRMNYLWGPDAASYNPERWFDPVSGKLIHFPSHKFFAFSAGPRVCLGMNLALLELKIVLASLLSRLDVEVLEPGNVTYDFSLTLPVRGELLGRISLHIAQTEKANA
ncbi:hypothetical protein Poli38472_005324 [Pythium oligandrum]|uniref:Cytochrome P450 n=1 Tax=Pythium oligandrum TaxID=41045 RepID=A0A8K1CFT8_PYTOL|nr:hypothetical protein Poli38472_005324 [Pythium oligandrum]|eukprot:TMW62706.1 hypothetical protein Poli38472_005324 [Pythium oligandrum]